MKNVKFIYQVIFRFLTKVMNKIYQHGQKERATGPLSYFYDVKVRKTFF